jgi:hypothetical protein
MTPPGIEPAAFRLVAQCIKKLDESYFCDMEVRRIVRRSPCDGFPAADRVFVIPIPGRVDNMYKGRVKINFTL